MTAPRAGTLPEPPAATMIDRGDLLLEQCERWRALDAIGLDTEFVRTRTFFPRLGLLQVGDPEGCWLIDVLAIDADEALGARATEAWRRLLESERPVKVLHSCSEDLEVLRHVYDLFPGGLFDSQVAATLCGYGYSLGYRSIVELLFGELLPKGETRSNWLKRPLTESQTDYAGLDVAYLLPMYEHLMEALDEAERTEWAQEEFARLIHTAEARGEQEYGYERLRKGKLTVRQRMILRQLSDWREQEARSRDLPRSFVASDDVLLHLTKIRPSALEELRNVKGLHPGERRRSGTELLRRIEAGESADMPARSENEGLLSRPGQAKGVVDQLRKVVRKVSAEHELPHEFLAQRRVVAELVTRWFDGEEEPLPEALRGWRRGVIGDRLLEQLTQHSQAASAAS